MKMKPRDFVLSTAPGELIFDTTLERAVNGRQHRSDAEHPWGAYVAGGER